MHTTIIIALCLLGIALVYYFIPPKKINSLYGYRTKKSMQSTTHWLFANKMASKGFLLIALINIPVSIVFTKWYPVDPIILFIALFLQFGVLIYWIEKKLNHIEQ